LILIIEMKVKKVVVCHLRGVGDVDSICPLEGDTGVEAVCVERGKKVRAMFAAVDCGRSVAGGAPDFV
jgi:hypothetical protein